MSQSPKPPPPPVPPEPDCQAQQGDEPSLATETLRQAAINQAFDYRGDVTIQTADGRTIEGYVFDRLAEGDEPYLRMFAKGGSQLKLLYSEITHLSFTGPDPAAGKSWETWLEKMAQKQKDIKNRAPQATDN